MVAVKTLLEEGLPEVTVQRNGVVPEDVLPDRGLVLVQDGEVLEPETSLGRTHFWWTMLSTVAVLVEEEDPDVRSAELDELASRVMVLLTVDRSLGGLADHVAARLTEISHEAVEGASGLAQATLELTIMYETADPLG